MSIKRNYILIMLVFISLIVGCSSGEFNEDVEVNQEVSDEVENEPVKEDPVISYIEEVIDSNRSTSGNWSMSYTYYGDDQCYEITQNQSDKGELTVYQDYFIDPKVLQPFDDPRYGALVYDGDKYYGWSSIDAYMHEYGLDSQKDLDEIYKQHVKDSIIDLDTKNSLRLKVSREIKNLYEEESYEEIMKQSNHVPRNIFDVILKDLKSIKKRPKKITDLGDREIVAVLTRNLDRSEELKEKEIVMTLDEVQKYDAPDVYVDVRHIQYDDGKDIIDFYIRKDNNLIQKISKSKRIEDEVEEVSNLHFGGKSEDAHFHEKFFDINTVLDPGY